MVCACSLPEQTVSEQKSADIAQSHGREFLGLRLRKMPHAHDDVSCGREPTALTVPRLYFTAIRRPQPQPAIRAGKTPHAAKPANMEQGELRLLAGPSRRILRREFDLVAWRKTLRRHLGALNPV